MIALEDIRSLTDFQRNTKAHLKRLKATGRPEVLTVNGKAELIVQDAAAYEETLDAIRGIQRGLDGLKAGTGKPARKALEEIRSRHKIPRPSRTKTHQAWVDEAMAGEFRPGSAARLRKIAAKARAAVA
jgi:PHD/YefM family antitoxin component YafN of YafNO toxin-antitoxin module